MRAREWSVGVRERWSGGVLEYWLVFLFVASSLAAEQRLSLSYLPAGSYSDPYGLTYQLIGDESSGLSSDNIQAFWISGNEPASPSEEALAPFRAGTFLLHSDQGHFLHIRRVPGNPAKPDSRLLLRIHSKDGLPTYLYPKLPEDLKQKQVDVFLLIDKSLSMRRNDKLRLRVAAAKAFADLARGGGRIGHIGIVAFNHEAELLLPPTDVNSKQLIFEAADKIRNGGETDLDGAIELAMQEFDKLPDSEKVAILLTDGKDQPGVYENAHRLFAEKKWPLHAIGLSKNADHETLQRIARETGGNYHDAPTSAELQRIFGDICFSLQNRTLIRRNTVRFESDQEFKSTYPFDASLKNVALTVRMKVPEDDQKNFTAQQTISPPEATAEEILTAKGEGAWRYFDLWNPKPGEWSLKSSVSKSTEAEIEATAITDLNLWHFPLPPIFEWGEPVSLFAGLAAGNAAFTRADLIATVRFPDGTDKKFKYQVQDSLYALTLPDQIPTGNYQVHLRATGMNGEGGPFERELRLSFKVQQTKSPRLWLSKRDLDFGQLYPGENNRKDFQAKVITAEDLNRHPMRTLELLLKTQGGTAFGKGGIEFAPLTTSSRELTTHQISLSVLPEQEPGVYEGYLLLQHSLSADKFELKPEPARIALRVEVMPQTLIVEPQSIDFRIMQTGQTKRASLKMHLEPRGTVPLTIKLVRGDTRVENKVELPAGVVMRTEVLLPIQQPSSLATQETILSLPLTIGRHASPGTRRWNLHIKAGRNESEIPIRFALQWPELNILEEGIDFGRVFCGQSVEHALTFTHNSMHSEIVELAGLDTDAARQAHLSGESNFRIEAVGEEAERATRQIKLTLDPPDEAVPGDYTGKLKLITWFGQTEIVWRAHIDVAKGFYVSNPLVTFADVRPGTERTAEITVRSTIAKEQNISLRALFSRLPEGLSFEASPSRISLGPNRSARFTVALRAEENVPVGSYSESFQLRGPYNSASLQARATVVPKRAEVVERPFELTLIEQAPGPPAPPPPTFGVFPPFIDISRMFPGDTMLIELEIEADFAQRVTLSHPMIDTLQLDPITTITELGDNDAQTQPVLIRIPQTADKGLHFTAITFTNGEQTQTVPVSVMVEAPIIEPEPVAEVAVVAPILSAPQPAKVMLPNWLRNLLWLLLLLVALAIVVAALRWIFSIDVPEMTKFYLASGILHVVLALLGAVYYLEEKVIEVEQPQRLSVQFVEKQESTPETVVEQSDPIPSLDQKPIEVKKEETQTEQQPQKTQETSQARTAAENSAETQAVQEVEVEKNTEESQTKLADAASESSKANSAEQAKLSEPQMQFEVRQAKDTETEKQAVEVEVEREIEKSERERVREETKPQEKEAETVTPEKQEQPEKTEIAEAVRQEKPVNETRTVESVTAESQPTEQKTEQAETKELKTAEVEVARAKSESTKEKSTVESQPKETEPKEVQVEKSQSEPAEVQVARASSNSAPAESDLQSESVNVEVVKATPKSDASRRAEVSPESATPANNASAETQKAKSANAPKQKEITAAEVKVEKTDSASQADVKEVKAGRASPASISKTTASVEVQTPKVETKTSDEPSLTPSTESASSASREVQSPSTDKKITDAAESPATPSEVQITKTADQSAPSLSSEQTVAMAGSKSTASAVSESTPVETPTVSQPTRSAPVSDIKEQASGSIGQASQSPSSDSQKQIAVTETGAQTPAQSTGSVNIEQTSEPSLATSEGGADSEVKASKGNPGIAESATSSEIKSVQKLNVMSGAPTINVGEASQAKNISAPASQGRQTAQTSHGGTIAGTNVAPTQRPSSGTPAGSTLASSKSGAGAEAQASPADAEQPDTAHGIGAIALKKETSGNPDSGLTSGLTIGGSLSGAESGRTKKATQANPSGSGASSAKSTTGIEKAELDDEAQLASGGRASGSGRSHSSNSAEETTVTGGPVAKYVGEIGSVSELDHQSGIATITRLTGTGSQSKTTRNAPRELAGKSRLANSSVLGPTRNDAQPGLYPAISSSGGKRGSSPDIETTAMATPDSPGESQQVTGQIAGEDSVGISIGASGTSSGINQAAPGTGKSKLNRGPEPGERSAEVSLGDDRSSGGVVPGPIGTGDGGRGTSGLGTGSGEIEDIPGGGFTVMVAKASGGGGGLAPTKVSFGGHGTEMDRGKLRGKSPASRQATVQVASSRLPLTSGPIAEYAPRMLNQDAVANLPAFNPVPGRQMTEFITYLASFGEFHGRTKFRERQVGAMSFLKDEVERRLSFILRSKVETIPFSNRSRLMHAPWLFMTGEFSFEYSQTEASNLRDYLEGGGWLWVDDCSEETDNTFDRSFHEQIRLVLPDAEYGELPMDHPVFSSCYPLREGYEGYSIPPGDKFRETRLHAYFIDGRPAIIYSRNDYGCGLEIDPKKGTAGQRSQTDLSPEQMREGALRMSMNLVFYFLGERGVQVERTRIVEEAEEEMQRRKTYEEKWRSLFLNGKLDDIEDFEKDTAKEWIANDWENTDVPELAIIGADGRNKLDVKFEKNHDKSTFERDFGEAEKLDLSGAHAILMDVNNQSTAIVRLALALSTGGQEYIYHESPQVVLKPGMNRNVLFRLGKNFKTAPLWEYNQELQGAGDVRKMTFLIYAIKPGRLIFDNFQISTVKKEDLVKWLQSGLQIQQKITDNVNDRE